MPNITDYASIVGEDLIEELYLLAEKNNGKIIQNINSTFEGGGVAEILSRIVPLLRQLGIDANWSTIKGDEAFFRITKKFHNALQGIITQIRDEDLAYFLMYNHKNAEEIDFYGDIMIIHDPQPIALIDRRDGKEGKKWVWRCHIDLTTPQMNALDFLNSYIKKYDLLVFSSPKYARRDIGIKQSFIAPSIDPLSDKNKEIPQSTISSVLRRLGIDMDRPIVTQVSRFDQFKNPFGVIEIYRKVKKNMDFQLVLAGGGATDDPEGQGILEKIETKVNCDPDIHIIDLPPSSDLEINALQRASNVVLQNSSREGFGLTVSEALWKARPVIASAVGGIPLQIIHKHSGILTNSLDETTYYLTELLGDPDYAMKLGINGREHVKNNFLITRHIKDCLNLFSSL